MTWELLVIRLALLGCAVSAAHRDEVGWTIVLSTLILASVIEHPGRAS